MIDRSSWEETIVWIVLSSLECQGLHLESGVEFKFYSFDQEEFSFPSKNCFVFKVNVSCA